MKNAVCLLLSLVLLALGLTGCKRATAVALTGGETYTDHSGIYLTLTSVDRSGDTPTLNALWHNDTALTVTYGNWFVIERKEGESWIDVSIADVEFNEVALVLEPGKTNEKSYTTRFADISKEGTYRLRTEFYVQEKRCTVWAEFQVLPSGSVPE